MRFLLYGTVIPLVRKDTTSLLSDKFTFLRIEIPKLLDW